MQQQKDALDLGSLRALYVGGAPYEVERIDDRTLEVYVERAWFRSPFESFVRDLAEQPLAAGDVETTDAFTAHILEVDARGAPTRVRFQFIRPLDDPRWLWLRYEGAVVVSWRPPAVADKQRLAAVASFL
jgi:hypothetical protein